MNLIHITLLVFAFFALLASNFIFGNTLLESHYVLEKDKPKIVIVAEE